jgi:hypothetical protein
MGRTVKWWSCVGGAGAQIGTLRRPDEVAVCGGLGLKSPRLIWVGVGLVTRIETLKNENTKSGSKFGSRLAV